MAIGLEKVSFHFSPKESQYQRMYKLTHNCTQLTHQQGNAQNSPSQASTVCEPRNSECSSWIQKRQRNQRSNCKHLFDHRKKQENSRKKKIYFCFIDHEKAFVWITTNSGKFLRRCEYQITLPASQEICIQIKKQQ